VFKFYFSLSPDTINVYFVTVFSCYRFNIRLFLYYKVRLVIAVETVLYLNSYFVLCEIKTKQMKFSSHALQGFYTLKYSNILSKTFLEKFNKFGVLSRKVSLRGKP
jgi:hypothetical protein